MKAAREGPTRIVLESPAARAVIAKDFKGEKKTWMLTYFERERRPGSGPIEVAPVEGPALRSPDQSAPEKIMQSEDFHKAIAADVDRERVADINAQVPVGLDEKGNVIFRSLDEAQGEIEAYRKVADQIAACASPATEGAANG